MALDKVAVATITWVRSVDEEYLLGRSLALLSRAGLPVAAADRGTSASFTDCLQGLPGVRLTVPTNTGLVAQVKASLDLAGTLGRPFILYVEPDKEWFFEQRMSRFLQRASEQTDAGVVLASRSAESLDTFPPMQRYAEGVINHLCGQLCGSAGDYSYGPFLMNRALLPHIANVPDHVGWGWRHFAFATAHRLRLRVSHMTDDYPCPRDQRAEDDEERRHRLRQLSQNILGLIEGAGASQ